MGAADVLKRKKPRTRSVEIVLDDVLTARRDELIASISRLKRMEGWADSGDMSSEIPALQAELRKVISDVEQSTVTFDFKAISRNDWNALVEKYQDDEGKLGEPFEVQIVAGSSTGENKLTVKQVEKMYASSDWSAAETDMLFQGAWTVNREVRDIPFTPAGIEAILSTGSNSTTADQEE